MAVGRAGPAGRDCAIVLAWTFPSGPGPGHAPSLVTRNTNDIQQLQLFLQMALVL